MNRKRAHELNSNQTFFFSRSYLKAECSPRTCEFHWSSEALDLLPAANLRRCQRSHVFIFHSLCIFVFVSPPFFMYLPEYLSLHLFIYLFISSSISPYLCGFLLFVSFLLLSFCFFLSFLLGRFPPFQVKICRPGYLPSKLCFLCFTF